MEAALEVERQGPRAILDAAAARGQGALDEAAAKALLAEFGIAVPRGARFDAPGDAAQAVAGLTPPLALKALSETPLHKSDLGAVQLGLSDAKAVAEAAADIADRLRAAGERGAGFLVEEMARPGAEIVIGGLIDGQLGPAVMLGAGGIHAEILGDSVFRLCPIDEADAWAMIEVLRIAPILKGARGRMGVDLDAIVAALMALAGPDGFFTRHAGRIAEFDLNPLIVRADGLTAVDARVVLGDPAPRAEAQPAPDFSPLFWPRTVAVAGASSTGNTVGNRYIRLLRDAGFAGAIFPIHPKAGEIEGLTAYPDIASVPEPIDYAFLTVPAGRVASVLEGAGGRLKFAQVMASTDPEAQAGWEAKLVALARREGFRLLGPNCMGTHSPRGRVTFMEGAGSEPGPIGVVCQSGGLGMDMLLRGRRLGLCFSGLATIGNSVDVGPSDLLEHYLADDDTKVIGLYLEDVKDGPRFAQLARRNAGRKPIVVLPGGVTAQGGVAAASHTGAMGGSAKVWAALADQAGLILTETLDGFLDVLQLCQSFAPRPETAANGITFFGNGGGTSVLATDALDRAGLALARPDAAARAAFGEIELPPGASLANPIDLPAGVLKTEDGRVTARILDINRRLVRPHATIIHLNLPVIMGYRHIEGFLPNLMEAVFGTGDGPAEHRVLVIRSDRSEQVDAWRRTFRTEAIRHGVPSFDEMPAAIEALARFRRWETFRADAGGRGPET